VNRLRKETSGLQGADSDAPFRRLVEGVRDYAIFMIDPQGNVLTWNEGARRIKGYSADEILGQHISRFYPPEAIESRWPDHELAVASDVGQFEDEGWRVRKDGSRFWASVLITAIHDDAGRLAGFSKITRDLTERRLHEEGLRQSEERFRLLIEGVQDYAIFLLDTTGHVASWNAGAQRLKGYAPEEIIGKPMSTFYEREAVERSWPQRELELAAAAGRFEDEGWRLRKDGTRFWANVVITALRDANGVLRGYSKITRDLTERRENEERLRRSEERFRLLLEGVADYAIFMLDEGGHVTSWNAGAQRISGYTPDEIIGRNFDIFCPAEDVALGMPAEELRTATLNRRAEARGWRVRKDGTRYWADVVVTALHDDAGNLRGFAKVVRDLSERKRMETLEEEGRHLTEFLAMLAHELRNPLAPIRNAAAILAAQKGLSPQASWCRDVIERQALHLTRLVDDLLDVSRITQGKLHMHMEAIDVNMAVQRAVEAVRPLIDARGHHLAVHLAPSPVAMNGDMTRITQVAINLLNNAAKFTSHGGEIRVSTMVRGHDALIRVTDNGEGIPQEMLGRVFDLFTQGERTLDRSEGGLGIGLTLARRIVALHGGDITAVSAGAGQGAEFTVSLPLLR